MTNLKFLLFTLLVFSLSESTADEAVLGDETSALPPFHLTSGQSHMPRLGYGTAAIQVSLPVTVMN